MRSAQLSGLRGATTCSLDTPEEIQQATQELLRAMMDRNDLSHDDIVSVIFTTTPDLTSTFPATVARGIGFGDIPLLCASEIDVPGAMPRVVRILMHVYSTRARSELRHVYLRSAQDLRDDLPE
jgi:chorismate mutase